MLLDASIPTLLDAAARATVLFLVAGLVSLVLRRRSASARHLVWSLALVGALLFSFAAAVAPTVALPLPAVVARAMATPSVAAPAPPTVVAVPPVAPLVDVEPPSTPSVSVPDPDPAPAPVPTPESEPAPIPQMEPRGDREDAEDETAALPLAFSTPSWTAMGTTVWIIGAVALMLRLALAVGGRR